MTTYFLLGLAAFFLIKRWVDKYRYNIKTISAQEALLIHKDSKAIFIDVRTPTEIANGKLDGAIEANVTSILFKKKIADLDKSKPYILYCRSGLRSNKACKLMSKAGFKNLTNVKGGYMAMK